MIIKEVITQQEYEVLLNIQKTNTILTFQNYGFEYINKNKFDQSDKIAFDIVTSILKKTIAGFSEFNNFLLNKNKEIRIRFQYDWSYDLNENNEIIQKGVPYTGVGYLFLDELLNGFREKKS